MSANCDNIFFFPIYGQFAAIWKSGSGRMVCKTYVFINSSNIIGDIKAVLFINFFLRKDFTRTERTKRTQANRKGSFKCA